MSVPSGTRYVAYIDESGDEGFTWPQDKKGSTKWFIEAAVVVKQQDDLGASACVDRIKQRLQASPAKPLHWLDVRQHLKRKVIMQEVVSTPISVIFVGMDKTAVSSSMLQKPPGLYFYTTRFLLERVSWLVSEAGGRVDCVFENKTSLSYPVLQAYIKNLATDPRVEIKPVIDNIATMNKDQRKMLQVADACAGACFAAFEPDRFGNVEPSYLQTLRGLLYRRSGSLFSYGLKLFPVSGDQLSQKDPYTWLPTL